MMLDLSNQAYDTHVTRLLQRPFLADTCYVNVSLTLLLTFQQVLRTVIRVVYPEQLHWENGSSFSF